VLPPIPTATVTEADNIPTVPGSSVNSRTWSVYVSHGSVIGKGQAMEVILTGAAFEPVYNAS
jgi:hypothetical protein